MEKCLKIDRIKLGVCYYPEHWPKELWENDLDRMLEHGIEFIRIAEFAWNKFEPVEGIFDFKFFDEFLELSTRKGMKVIFCTPTATPPAWLTHKYPKVLNSTPDGTLYRHGLRRHYNYNSPTYRSFTERIVEKLGEHYGSHPAIIGWQIDNELNCEIDVFYSESDHDAFRSYMKNKFGTLERLNDAMGTAFWNQTYTAWKEVYLRRTTIHNETNPHMALEEKRFISESTISFCKLQADILRKYITEDKFITTNGIFGNVDYNQMTEAALDFITYDSYPNFANDTWAEPKKPGNLNDRKWSWSLSKVRAISPNFGVMEQQSGPGGWDFRMKQPAPKPGQMRLWTFQSIAHGADFVSYFRWRTCWIGTEIYWHGLNDYSNEPNRRLHELKRIWEDVKKASKAAGTRYEAKAAIIKDYDNEWDGKQDQWHGPLGEFSDAGWFTAAQLTHTPMDIVYLRDISANKISLEALAKYDLLIYPHATILTEDRAELLRKYVGLGGKLIMGARTGYKDEFGRCPMRTMPGFASELCGTKVIDYTHLGPGDDEEYAVWDGEDIEAPIFNDVLEPIGSGKILARFKGNYYDGSPALIESKLGKGTAYYYGAGFSSNTAEVFLRKLKLAEPYREVLELPKEVELAVRTGKDEKYLFILNYMKDSKEINIKEPALELISGKTLSGKVEIEGYGVIILNKVN